MFKKLILAIAFALPFSCMAQKFGVVDIEQIFQAMPEVADAEKQVQETGKKYEETLNQIQEELNKLYTEYQALEQDSSTPKPILERKVQEIQEKAQKGEEFRNVAAQDIAKLRETLLSPIHQRLLEAVKSVGAEGNYSIIFPNMPEMLMYTGNDVENVSAQVKAKLGIK